MSRSESPPGRQGGRQAARLLVAAGALTFVNDYLPGAEHLDVALLNVVSVVAVAAGLAAWWVPWERLPRRTVLVLPLLAFALISVADRFGGVSPFSFAVYFVVVFVWVGVSQPPGTSLILAPPAVAAYVAPFLTMTDAPTNAVSSVTVAIPVCILVAETTARVVRRLEDQRRREARILDALGDGVVVLDPHGAVRYANQTAADLLGRPVAQLVGRRLPLPSYAGDGSGVEVAPGRWLEVRRFALDGTGDCVVTLHDVSEARALDAAKDLFLAMASHELRTPLTVVKGYLQMLRRRWPELPEGARREAVDTAAARAEDLVALTNHLLLGARAGVSDRTVALAPVDVVALVERAVAGFRALSGQHHFDVTTTGPVPAAYADHSALDQVLAQLLENAVKYSPDGGTITVSVTTRPGAVVVDVLDEGVGIPPGKEREVFDRFYQGAGGDTRRFGGVGLGLFIVRRLVDAMHGTVEATRRTPRGTRVRVTLPVAAAGAGTRRTGGVVAPRPGEGTPAPLGRG